MQLRNSKVILMGEEVNRSEMVILRQRKRIKIDSTLRLLHSLFELALGQAPVAESIVAARHVRAELDGLAEFRFSTLPVPVVDHLHEPQDCVSIRQAVVDLQSLEGSRPCSREGLEGRHGIKCAHQAVQVTRPAYASA